MIKWSSRISCGIDRGHLALGGTLAVRPSLRDGLGLAAHDYVLASIDFQIWVWLVLALAVILVVKLIAWLVDALR
jgi:hypothetical protein